MSPVVWKIARTFPNCCRINVFKANYRCHQNTRRSLTYANKGISSKNTNCRASLTITVKRHDKRTKSKNPDLRNKDWPCIVQLQNHHNHLLSSAEALRFRPRSSEVEEKLLNLFQKGHSVSSARRCLIDDIMIEFPKNYYSKIADGLTNMHFD